MYSRRCNVFIKFLMERFIKTKNRLTDDVIWSKKQDKAEYGIY